LQEIAAYFAAVRKKYRQFESEFTGVDTRVQVNQVPGGMMSNLARQLEEQGALARIHDVFAEIPRVRRDLGFPPLVTPTSQIVGTQALLNVLAGERYQSITNEVKRYLQGGYGRAPAPVDAELQCKAIGREALIEGRPADLLKPELAALRQEIGDLALNDTDVMIFAMFPEIGRAFLNERKAGTLRPEPLSPPTPAQPAADRVQSIGAWRDLRCADHQRQSQRPAQPAFFHHLGRRAPGSRSGGAERLQPDSTAGPSSPRQQAGRRGYDHARQYRRYFGETRRPGTGG